MMSTWRTTLTTGAIRNRNIKVSDAPFDFTRFTGGTNEAQAPKARLRVVFEPKPTAEMWIYGDKGLLTSDGRNEVISAFFAANGITDSAPVTIELSQTGPAEVRIRKV